jgi:hypothetical protein
MGRRRDFSGGAESEKAESEKAGERERGKRKILRRGDAGRRREKEKD